MDVSGQQVTLHIPSEELGEISDEYVLEKLKLQGITDVDLEEWDIGQLRGTEADISVRYKARLQ